MNILYLTDHLNNADGVSSHLYNLINELKKHKDIRIILICGGGDAIEKFSAAGAEVTVFENISHSLRSPGNFASAIFFVYKYLKKNKIDIVHSHNHYSANIARKSSKFYDTITVQTIHGIIPAKGKLAHHPGNNFITVSDHVLKSVRSNIKPEDRIELIYNGYTFRNDFQKMKNPRMRFIAASRLEQGKGLDTLIKAVSKLPNRYRNNAEFIIAGKGSIESGLMRMNTELQTGIFFPGEIKNLPALLDETDVLVITSESEGLPMIMIEAAASKNAVISSDFAGVNDLILNKKEGLIYKMNDSVDLAEKIRFAIDNQDKMKEISEAFFEKAKVKFNVAEMGLKHLNFYYSLLK